MKKVMYLAVPAAVLLALVASTPASAASTTPDATTTSSSAPMIAGGFNAAVAEANGFKIEVGSDGITRSVPVTDSAKQLAAEAESRAAALTAASGFSVSPDNTVTGSCGASSIYGYKGSSNDVHVTSTGYNVIYAVAARNWIVDANGFITGDVYQFPLAATSASWHAAVPRALIAIGPGEANVPPFAASVLMVNGEECYSSGPSFSFG